MTNEETKIVLGMLEKRVKANQSGLLSLFSAAGYKTSSSGEVSIKDLYTMSQLSKDDFIVATALLFPECNSANASDAWVFNYGEDSIELSTDRLNRLGIDKNYKYQADLDNFEGVTTQMVSYKTIAKYLALIILAALVAWLVYYLYKRYVKK